MDKEKIKKLTEKGTVVTFTPWEYLGINGWEEDIAKLDESMRNEIHKRKQDKEEKRLLDRSRVGNKTST